MPVALVTSDEREFAVLQASRFFFMAFSGQDPNAWAVCFQSAHQFFPGPRSAEVMQLTLNFVQAMRCARRSMFRYSNPRCEHCAGLMTQDERHFVEILQNTRLQRRSRASSAALMLCEGHDPSDVMAAAEMLAACLWPLQASKSLGMHVSVR